MKRFICFIVATAAFAQVPEQDLVHQLQEKVAAQETQIQELTQILRGIVANQAASTRTVSLNTTANVAPASPAPEFIAPKPAAPAAAPAPLSWALGSAFITPIGFADFTSVNRSTNPGSGIGTNFGSIPFSNATNGNLTENRLSTQNSRIGLRVDTKVGDSIVLGYLEADFLGFLPTNGAVSSNSDSLRMRLYWLDVRRKKFEVLAGQSWSMLTPGRNGISPLPGDLFFTQNIDTNYQAGLVWGRVPQFRAVYHPTNAWALGVSLENPEQYIGGSSGGGLVTLPSALATAYVSQLDNGNTTLSVPGLHPDIIAKLAWDGHAGKRNVHAEIGGVLRTMKVYDPARLASFEATGGGGQANLNVEIFKNARLVTNNYYSDGGGRYIFGQAPDLIIRGDGTLSLVHAGSTVSGLEVQVKKSLFYSYYGGVYIARDSAIDPATGARVGYGYAGSSNGQNRSIQEITMGFTQTLWKDPKFGALSFMTQYSYVFRSPWYVAPGQPASAQTNMVFADLRYTLPGAPPTIK
jgi:hypothetical protein